MKLSLNWLSNFVDLSGLSTEEIIEKTIKAGFEVEEIIYLGQGTNLTVGKILECTDHPDSDHLHLTKVDIGSEVLDIVCGAPNCRAGLKVIVAKVGAKLPGGEIKAGVIRGQASNGMLCSLKELGIDESLLPDNSPSLNGIEELDDSFELGDDDVLKHLGYGDVILDLSIYANRPDCLSMFAMAKEMGAILHRECKLPDYLGSAAVGTATTMRVNSFSDNCPHFLAKVVNNVKIKESPEWLKAHLRANGIKSINNLVDISNYVMLETGQPLHFYDLRSNPAREITVIDDYEGDYTALDGITYKIEKGDLMITTNGECAGIAGIMGGDATKILDDTSSILIEAALFNNAQIRRTANRLGLMTEAAMRFAKGLDPLAQNKAMDRAVQLLCELADASGLEATAEYGSNNYEAKTVSETLEHLNALIGKQFTMEEVVDVLNRLDFAPEYDEKSFTAHIPSYRTDISIREDIDEEIIRLTNFDDLQATLPLMPQTIGKLSPMQELRRKIRDILTVNGLQEIATYTLTEKKYIEEACLPLGEAVELLSPISEQRRYVRTSLLNSILEVVRYNLDHFNSNINVFEISKVYALGKEQERLGLALNGSLASSKLMKLDVKADFYVLKGLLLALLDKLGFEIGRVSLCPNTLDIVHFHPYMSAVLLMDGEVLAIFGKLHPAYLTDSKNKDIYYAEVMLDLLANSKPKAIKALTVNKFPAISRDISIVVKDDVKADELIKAIKKAVGPLATDVTVFDIYKGEHIAEGYKSVSLSITYESYEKTLKVDDIVSIHDKVLTELNKHYQANQR